MDLAGRHVLVAGAGITGKSFIQALSTMDVRITVTADSAEQLSELEDWDVELAPGLVEPPADTALVLASSGWRPSSPLLVAAANAGIEVIGDVELAWRLGQQLPNPPIWLTITGTNGKTTTVRMAESMLRAAGISAVACGNVGYPVLDAVLAGYQVLAVELSSYQLHWADSLAPHASVVLNVAEDHLQWHGSMAEYAAAKGKSHRHSKTVIYNADDERSIQLANENAAADAAAVGFSLDVPRPGELGLVEDILVDRAFVADPAQQAEELATIADVQPAVPYNVANALAAAALTRAYGVPAGAVAKGLREYQPAPHRSAFVAEIDGVRYINDTKATNPHAAAASFGDRRDVVWIAGGQLKGATVDNLVRTIADRLRAVVLLGKDAPIIADALARHAPNVPVKRVLSSDHEAMTTVVRTASALAQRGDVVLLAPAGDSLDMYRDYTYRGDAFIEAVHSLKAGSLRDGG